MISDFVRFCGELFPSISPYTATRTLDAIEQFRLNGKTVKYLMMKPFEIMCQGDIFENIPFLRYDDNGNIKSANLKAQILTNTCDCQRDEYLTFAAMLPISDYSQGQFDAIKRNVTFRLLYMPDTYVKEYVIDFSLLTTIPRTLINQAIEIGKINRLASLSQIGFHLFIAKLTVYFMRPEDAGVNDSRSNL